MRGRLRTAIARLAAIALAVLLVAGCASSVRGSGRLAAPDGSASPTPTTIEASRTCPSIVDPQSRLSYTCIDDSLERTFVPTFDPSFEDGGTVLTLTTEPGWVAAQQSAVLKISGASAQELALRIGAQQAADNYGEDPSATRVSKTPIPNLGLEAYRLDQLITLNSDYAQNRGLIVRTEMLCIVVVRIDEDTYSAMSMSIPDTQRDWWTRLDQTVASLKAL